jgi:membrane fusion protein (multidrug efflux system)
MPKTEELERKPLGRSEPEVETLDGVIPSSVDEAPSETSIAQEKRAEARPFYQKTPFKIFFAILAVLAVAGTFYWLHIRNFEDTDDAFIDGHVIPISPQVSALVSAVHVNDNQFVHKGDLLVELDSTDFKVALSQAQGAEAAAKGKLQQAQSAVPAAKSAVVDAEAQLAAAQVELDNAAAHLHRWDTVDQRARSQQQLDDASAAQKTAAAEVDEAKARVASAQTQIASAEASVVAAQGDYEKAEADTSRAKINLGYCTIVAPQDARITNKNVDAGKYVTPSSDLFALVPADVWVVANFKETQLDLMRPGQSVTIHVDAYPDHDFHGKVQSIQAGTGSRFSVIPAENATGNFVKVVQRVPVKITFDGDVNTEEGILLSPGMSVEPVVRVRDGKF